MNEANVSRIVSVVQVLSALCMSGLIIYVLVISMRMGNAGPAEVLMRFAPTSIMLILSIFPVFILRIKHRSMAVEGSYIPLYLFFVTLSSLSTIPALEDFIGIYMFSYVLIQKLARFFFLGSSIVLLFAALVNYDAGKNLQKSGLYATAGLVTAFLIAFFIPVNSNIYTVNKHEFELLITIFVIMFLSMMTYLASFLKDKESYALKRFVTIVFLSLGHFIVIVGSTPYTIIGAVMYFIGVVMLCAVSPTGY